ncbi:integral membrane protein [Seiridium cupressi]
MDVPDRGPEVLAVSWTLPVLSLIFLVLRLYCKFMRHRGLWWDDHVLTASWIASLVCSIILTVNVRAGFGKHQRDIATENLASIGMRGVMVGIFMVLATAWSKTSFALTLLRLVNGWQKTALWVIIVTVNIFLTLSGFTNLLQCSPVDKVWQPYLPGTCWPSNVNLGISMKRREKFGVAVAMSMGVFAAVTGIIKCVKLQALASADFFYDGGDLSIWSMAEIHTTIMAASIPVLRALGREITSSAGRYYAQSHDRTRRYTRTGDNTVTITSSKRPPANYQSHDGASDKSILHGGIGKIMQVNEIQIKYGNNSDNEGAYELDKVDRHRSPI